MDLQILPVETPKQLIEDENDLVFGKLFTDRMFVMEFDREKGWHSARIQPYGPLQLDPAAVVLHYSQEIFEGLKAFRRPNGDVALFRPEDNVARFNRSAQRMCMPEVDEKFFLDSMLKLIRLEEKWIPHNEGTSLYIRPTMIATEAMLGVHPADKYLCYVILSPVGAYYKGGIAPVNIWISDFYVRAADGGTGEAKTGGNYAASLYAAQEAAKNGYDQVLWLDAKEKRYVEEVGSMNMLFLYDGKIVTSPLRGTVLDGITRRSTLTLAKELGYEIEERAMSVDEIMEGVENGRLTEAFGTGTAVVISPVGSFCYKDKCVQLGDGNPGKLTMELYNKLTSIQYGKQEDKYNWVTML